MNRKTLLKFTPTYYAGAEPEIPVAHYCALCDRSHTIPEEDWVLLVRPRPFGRKDLRMVCRERYEELTSKKEKEEHV